MCAVLCVMVSWAAAQETATVPVEIISYPDLILYNGKIMTMDDASTGPSPGSIFQAIALRDRRIQALGADAEILSYAGPATERINLQGKTVIPGIVDAHTHIHNSEVAWWAQQNPQAFETMGREFVVGGMTSEDLKKGIELVLKERMSGVDPDKWAFISLPTNSPDDPGSGTGVGVNFLQQRDITLQDLDTLSPNNPVLLRGHPAYMINSAGKKAIEQMYGFFPPMETADDTGFGELTTYRRSLMVDGYFRVRPRELADIVEQGLRKNAAAGITTFSSHMMGLQFLNAYQILIRENRMPIRYAYTHYFGFQGNSDPASFYMRLGDMEGLGNDYFWAAGVGLGNVDSGPPKICTTMEAPPEVKNREWCRDEPGNASSKAVLTAVLSKERVAVGHVYGDKAVDYFMDTLEEAMQLDPTITLDYIRSRRFTADHCGFYPRPDQIPRIARLGMIISCGGNSLSRSYPWLERYGLQYAKWISPVKSLIDGGVRTVYENEAGVQGLVSETYFYQGYALITRKNEYGAMVAPEEAIDRMTLMKMSTSWPAEFALREAHIGTLEAGKLADLLVLNRDYFTVPEEEIPEVFPLLTMVGGKIQVLRSEFAGELGRDPVGPQMEFRNEPQYASAEGE
jgi:predicted amidohydrolase YtcJ